MNEFYDANGVRRTGCEGGQGPSTAYRDPRTLMTPEGVYIHCDAFAEIVGDMPVHLRNAFFLGFKGGWLAAAKWAERPDLAADICSPAYLADRDEAMNREGEEA